MCWMFHRWRKCSWGSKGHWMLFVLTTSRIFQCCSLLFKAFQANHVAYFAVYSCLGSLRTMDNKQNLAFAFAFGSCCRKVLWAAVCGCSIVQIYPDYSGYTPANTSANTCFVFGRTVCRNYYCSGFHVHNVSVYVSHVIIHILFPFWMNLECFANLRFRHVPRCAKQGISTRFSSAMSLLLCTWNLGCKDLDGQMPKEGSRTVKLVTSKLLLYLLLVVSPILHSQTLLATYSFTMYYNRTTALSRLEFFCNRWNTYSSVIDMIVHSGAWLLFL